MATRGTNDNAIQTLLNHETSGSTSDKSTSYKPHPIFQERESVVERRRASRQKLDLTIDHVSYYINFILLLLFVVVHLVGPVINGVEWVIDKIQIGRNRRKGLKDGQKFSFFNSVEQKEAFNQNLQEVESWLKRLISLFYWFFILRKCCYYALDFVDLYYFGKESRKEVTKKAVGFVAGAVETVRSGLSSVTGGSIGGSGPAVGVAGGSGSGRKSSSKNKISLESVRRIYRDFVEESEQVKKQNIDTDTRRGNGKAENNVNSNSIFNPLAGVASQLSSSGFSPAPFAIVEAAGTILVGSSASSSSSSSSKSSSKVSNVLSVSSPSDIESEDPQVLRSPSDEAW